jgi:hypothetical protein
VRVRLVPGVAALADRGDAARWTSSCPQHLRSGLNAELASEYHGLVLELGLAAAVEADAAGTPVPDSTWDVLLRMTDALASIVDNRLRPPRQGDADDGHGLIVDGAETDRWASLLAHRRRAVRPARLVAAGPGRGRPHAAAGFVGVPAPRDFGVRPAAVPRTCGTPA